MARLFPDSRRARAAALIVISVIAVALWIRLGPIAPELLADPAHSTIVVDRNGVPLYESLSDAGTRSMTVTVGGLPPLVVAATVAAEDRRFWSHPGVDPVAIMRALKINLAERRIVEGGSTISQQVAKLLLNRRDPQRARGLAEKIAEAILALRLEHRLSKRELLALYLNLASYGNQIVGVERASHGYFGQPASMLTPAQAAFLAGLPQRPSRFNPYRSLDLAISRQRSVLRRMVAAGALSPAQAQEARDERLVFRHTPSPHIAPHFVEMVLAGVTDPRPPRIETTLDRDLQADVRGIVASHRESLRTHGAHNVAVVVLDHNSGEWLAWEGSGDYEDSQHGGAINGPLMPRQPGSALKPFTYALAFEQGHTPASVLADVPSHFKTAEDGIVYSPRNYDGGYRGPLLARRALAGSQNVPAVALASELGVPALLRFLTRAGMTTFEKNAAFYGLGVTLGNAEVRLDELVAAYASFARGGVWMRPVYLRGPAHAAAGMDEPMRQVMSSRAAFWVTDILSDPDAREYVFGRGGSLEFPFPVAVKTGTSQAYHDNWTIGYSRHVTVGVWVGNFDRTPLRNSSGVTGAAPIFHAVMLAAERHLSFAHRSAELMAPPPDVERREICALSGMRANAWCPLRQGEWLDRGAELLPCSWHHQSDDGVMVIWPTEYREWAATAGLLREDHHVPASQAAVVARADSIHERHASPRFQIANPPEGAIYSIDPTLRRDFQTLALKVVAANIGRVDWLVDGAPVGSTDSNASIAWPLSPGQHRITARHEDGSMAETIIHVR